MTYRSRPAAHCAHLRWLAPAVATSLWLAGCGGGSTATDETAAEATRQAQSHVVVRANDAGVATEGSFARTPGYLALSPKVLRSQGASPAKVTMSAAVARAGWYEVFVRWPQAIDDTGAAKVAVVHAGGRSERLVDQRSSGGDWISLGGFAFDAAGARVVFERVGAADLVVDAVRLQWLGDTRPALTLASPALPVGMKDQAYAASVNPIGGQAPFTYSLSGGQLPPGLSLDAASGAIAGQAAMAGSYTFELTVQDAAGARATLPMGIEIGDSSADESLPAGRKPAAASERRQHQSVSSQSGDLSDLQAVIAGLPEGGWGRVNLNAFSDVWTPADLRPLHRTSNPTPSKIILAWSSFAWDSNRGNLMLYGGGHANYRGNDVYRWRGDTRMWERASLPSEMFTDALGNVNAVDGAGNAPASAHTYDNNMFLPLLDRMLVLGGAADPNGGHYLTQNTATTSRKTGPYLFDPARADGDKVGGTTGSHVQRVAPYPEVVGGQMWRNRDSWLHASATSAPPSESFVNGCTGYAEEDGQDVTYVRTASRLYRYRVLDIDSAAADRWEQVGRYYGGSGTQAVCSYDTERRLFVTTNRNAAAPFAYWNLNTASTKNNEVYFTPTDPSGEFPQLLAANNIDVRYCGLEFDPVRANHKLWCGDGRVWTLQPPAVASASGWTITKVPAPTTAVPGEPVGTGILGKWKYIPNLDVFMGLADPVQGNIWVYKPIGWSGPAGNLSPQVSLTAPADGAEFDSGSSIALTATASDSDGSVAKVEFFAGSTKVGEDTTAPYARTWASPADGNYTLSAVATDDEGATRTSGLVHIAVRPPIVANTPPTVALTSPADGLAVTVGTSVLLQATASDTDGSIAKVVFFRGSTQITELTSAPYAYEWTNAPAGTHVLTAEAIDDDGAATTSAPVNITVSSVPGSATTVVLQRGSNAAQVADTYLSSYHKTLNFGGLINVQDQKAYYSPLLHFAVFASEGGPVPDGATIHSAVLSVYKYSSYDMVYGVHRMLQPWSESTATWNVRLPGVAWSQTGANAAGQDFATTADAVVATPFDPGWLDFDVTAAVQAFSAQPASNLGWRLRAVNGYTSALKKMYASEFDADPALRPKLVVTYE